MVAQLQLLPPLDLITITAPAAGTSVQQSSRNEKNMTVLQRLSLAAFPLLIICCTAAHAEPRCAENVATVVSAQGNVDLRGKDTEAWQPVKADTEICAGDSVTVRRFSRAVLRLEQEQTNIQLGEGTTLTLPGTKEQEFSVVELLKGITHFISRVPHALKIKTPFVNAAVEGTEFIVKVGDDQTLVSVSEGQVLADNADGQLMVQSGQSALAKSGAAPSAHTIADPMETVQWALYYPHVFEFEPQSITNFGLEPWRAVVADSVRALRANDLRTALTLLEQAGEGITSTQYLLYRAHLLLTVGRVAEAQADIEQVLAGDPGSSIAWVIRSIIAVTQGRAQLALESAQKAVQADEKSAPAYLALSYGYQAKFDLDQALTAALTATRKNEDSALAWARVAELQLMHGYIDKALLAAQRAERINPNSAQAKTVLGFAYLAELEIKSAATAFDGAIHLDPAAPLPRLGLGLARIRQGELVSGRTQIEIATSLDPRNSLLRSYVGKAYYEENRGKLAGEQFAQAKEIDPNDPTPWLYDALLKQAQNRPVEALRDIQKSIEMNDNRAVYRSRLLLDDDLAARSASQARIYKELGFDQLALSEAYKSINLDPSNFSAHRYLADAYAALPRREIARVSEALQAQLLQPLGINPASAQLAEGNATLSDYIGGAPSYNEYASLFVRDGFAFKALGVSGNQATQGGDLAVSAMSNPFALSAGKLHFETDGYRKNADLTQDVQYIFGQWALTPTTNLQVEKRRSELDLGDVVLRFGADNFRPDFRRNRDEDSLRLGFRYSPSPAHDLLLSWARNNVNAMQTDLTAYPEDQVALRDNLTNEVGGLQVELQHLYHRGAAQVIWGLGYIHESIQRSFLVDVFESGVYTESYPEYENVKSTVRHSNAYVYVPIELGSGVITTAGASIDYYRSSAGEYKQYNPKLGVLWNPNPATALRLAYMRGLKRPLLNNQTLEPTQVAGFNQLFDDTNATDARRYGVGVDRQWSKHWSSGFEAVRRNATAHVFSNGLDKRGEAQKENSGRFYTYWTPIPEVALSATYEYDYFVRDDAGSGSLLKPSKVVTRLLPVALNFNHPSGLFVKFTTTAVGQKVTFLYDGPSVTGNDDLYVTSGDRFWLTDMALGYRFPRRIGTVGLTVKNLFDTAFQYQSANTTDTSLLPSNRFQPKQMLVANVSVNF